ncbi:MAG: hypothetical protein AABZ10_13980 [Nitrospirota bacterium]
MYPPCIQSGVMVCPVMSEESYVVRIYRKEPQAVSVHRTGDAGAMEAANTVGLHRAHDRIAITGTVEDVEHGMRRYFCNIEEPSGRNHNQGCNQGRRQYP